MERSIKFGKYKGALINYLILTHIGYIAWCLKNIDWFKLEDEEQQLFDAVAIAIVKSGVIMYFPIEDMRSCIKNTKALETLDSPFNMDSDGLLWSTNISDPLVQIALKYKDISDNRKNCHCTGDLYTIAREYDKMLDDDMCDDVAYSDIF